MAASIIHRTEGEKLSEKYGLKVLCLEHHLEKMIHHSNYRQDSGAPDFSGARKGEARSLEKEMREQWSREREKRKRKYEEYISEKRVQTAVIGRRPPYHLIYAKQEQAGKIPCQGSRREENHEQERDQRNQEAAHC